MKCNKPRPAHPPGNRRPGLPAPRSRATDRTRCLTDGRPSGRYLLERPVRGSWTPYLYLPEILRSERWVRYGDLLRWLALEQCPSVGWEADTL